MACVVQINGMSDDAEEAVAVNYFTLGKAVTSLRIDDCIHARSTNRTLHSSRLDHGRRRRILRALLVS
jgi:hypothetical protein